MSYQPYLEKAIEAAQAAEKVINQYYQQQLDITKKKDKSPVTQADIESEEAIRGILSKAFPEHGFFGEELGQENVDAEYVWYIDPIDGTKSFVREYPMFSTQIALKHKGEFVLGVSNAPGFSELATAVKGEGAQLNGQAIHVSNLSKLNEATLSFGNVKHILADLTGGLKKIIKKAHRVRGYGDFFHYHLLASGKIDMVIESEVNILDIAALSVIVNEAGGRFTDIEGRAINDKTTTVLATNAAFHEQLLLALND